MQKERKHLVTQHPLSDFYFIEIMRNQVKSATTMKYSNRFARMFKKFRRTKSHTPSSTTPSMDITKQYGGQVFCKILAGGIYHICWSNTETGQKAQAFGKNFQNAYQNLSYHLSLLFAYENA